MKWWIIPVIVLYFIIGNYFTDAVKEQGDNIKLLMFIFWPLVVIGYVVAITVMGIVLVIYWTAAIIKYLLGGFDDGVV